MSAAEHLQEAIDVGCTRDDHDHVADHRAEVLREAGGIADQLIAAVPHTDPDGLAKVDAYRAYSDRLHEIADCGELAGKDTGGAPAGESTQPATDDDDRVMRTVRDAIEDFDFAGYGLDDVDPRSEYAEWVGDLASAITGAIGGETA